MPSLEKHIRFARGLTTLMDIRFSVLGIRFGLDPLLDVIPGLGSFLAAGTSCYLFWIAYRLKVPGWVYVRMAWNILIDYLVGIVPYIGIVFDVFFRANVRNFAMLSEFFDPDVLEGEIL